MASPAQITANRANAQSSTGPRSAEGKAASSCNSLKLGLYARSMILPGEDPAEFEQLTAEYQQRFQPVGPEEAALLEDIVRFHWMKRRFRFLEVEVFNARLAALPEDTLYPLGAVTIYDQEHGGTLNKIARRLAAVQRDWYKALDLLKQAQYARRRIEALDRAEAEGEADECPTHPSPNRVRFNGPPQPAHLPQVNLALRL
jgi:hypothetical protein